MHGTGRVNIFSFISFLFENRITVDYLKIYVIIKMEVN